ncbi:MAG: hypothetical protein PHO10_00745 [Gemmiger sp.]|nr:hypothetical protein [Gemmiger sp.]
MKDDDFDTLLQGACRAICQEDAAMAGFETAAPPPRRQPHRRVYALLVAAALAGVVCMGAMALWPRLYLQYRNGRLYEMVENAPETVAQQQMKFTYLPEGYTLEWLDDQPEGAHYLAQISYQIAAVKQFTGKPTTLLKSFQVMQSPLRAEMGYHLFGDSDPMTKDEQKQSTGSILIRDSIQAVTEEDLQQQGFVYWLTPAYRYAFIFAGTTEEREQYDSSIRPNETADARNAEILKILQGITP